MNDPFDNLLLTRSGRASLPLAQTGWPGEADPRAADWLRALDVELLALGFVLTHRARLALGGLNAAQVVVAHAWLTATLGSSVGAGQKHEPLFRRFPYDIPTDTYELWLKKFVGFYIQREDQPCLWCDGQGQTHVISPCAHVVCDRCFDGSSYSACPVCERQVDRTSPFFTAAPPIPSPWENAVSRLGVPSRSPVSSEPKAVVLKRIDLAGPREVEASTLLVALSLRAQAMSPDDVAALRTVVECFGDSVLAWLPAKIPVRENVAQIFGTLLKLLPPGQVLRSAGPWLQTATDLLRVIAVWSGADAALQPVAKRVPVRKEEAARWSGAPAELALNGDAALPDRLRQLLGQHPEFRAHWMATDVNVRRGDIVVPFNERTAARGAVALPRGSRVSLPPNRTGDRLRLFLHWCEPARRRDLRAEAGRRPTSTFRSRSTPPGGHKPACVPTTS